MAGVKCVLRLLLHNRPRGIHLFSMGQSRGSTSSQQIRQLMIIIQRDKGKTIVRVANDVTWPDIPATSFIDFPHNILVQHPKGTLFCALLLVLLQQASVHLKIADRIRGCTATCDNINAIDLFSKSFNSSCSSILGRVRNGIDSVQKPTLTPYHQIGHPNIHKVGHFPTSQVKILCNFNSLARNIYINKVAPKEGSNQQSPEKGKPQFLKLAIIIFFT